MKTLRVLSLGAGVQSSVLALLCSLEPDRLQAAGYPRPDVAMFADTGWEPQSVYRHLDWLETQLAFPVLRVAGGDLKADLHAGAPPRPGSRPFQPIPLFHLHPDGSQAMLRRQCTRDYKVDPLYARARALLGVRPGQRLPRGRRVEIWLGLSTDEAQRMKPASRTGFVNRWPLIDLRMRRAACRTWFARRYPARTLPRSACVICPYRTDTEWADLRRDDPADWTDAVAYDAALRDGSIPTAMQGEPFLHRSHRPLGEALEIRDLQPSLWDAECEGLCGV